MQGPVGSSSFDQNALTCFPMAEFAHCQWRVYFAGCNGATAMLAPGSEARQPGMEVFAACIVGARPSSGRICFFEFPPHGGVP